MALRSDRVCCLVGVMHDDVSVVRMKYQRMTWVFSFHTTGVDPVAVMHDFSTQMLAKGKKKHDRSYFFT